MDHKIAISWIDLSFEVKSIFNGKKTTILDNLCGFAEFGALTAIMGPSGVGLTSLLKCLNGLNDSKLSPESKIRLNSSVKIRSAFIGHNEQDFLIMGLTAKQNMIYASKLKNSNIGNDFDHERNVHQIMADLLITDIMNTKAADCSGGEQRRLAFALELTAIDKPNIIFWDEPITGLDSNVAEVVSHSNNYN